MNKITGLGPVLPSRRQTNIQTLSKPLQRLQNVAPPQLLGDCWVFLDTSFVSEVSFLAGTLWTVGWNEMYKSFSLTHTMVEGHWHDVHIQVVNAVPLQVVM